MTRVRPPLVASLGDPAGVGPELFLKSWTAREEERLAPFAVVGSLSLMQEIADNVPLASVRAIESLAEAGEVFADALPVLDIGPLAYTPGAPTREGAEVALASLTRATELAITGEASALVTGPIAKAELQDVGFAHPGQTEFVAAACDIAAEDAVMMLAGPSLKVVPMTVHVSLASVPALLTQDLIASRIRIAAKALARDFGFTKARIAVAGLNPHAGEQGRMGREEIEVIAPAVEALRAEGLDVVGPLAGDTMFHAAARANYDLAVCMYHDQALIPIKALDFDRGVNVTLGLPIIRTSPDHGTAFSLAGTGRADAGPTIAALRMAAECADRRSEQSA
ncbi:4-hydroxythreonine-4-phosphate dehydrogenase PdxA [Croceicoccus gelatinilyticus]|uniref:4-hydroxythreonine-4-phosphate dehydrogenase PdxA n=1 Tax=Croceicoccus gelatinilyticus TaxID=2835536 RepID=UPI001BCD9837|nr:4-hydroxythreonine-4-phosphate dehydrogenase PdxA [Croceicoccus gelatinilyticus]MBS7670903.1 4-hydroxythreonine-4-phosphate dehydrogenase PdxA [Croceicoccus gelatinilyticus]